MTDGLIDATEIGVVAARVMADLERDAARGEFGPDPIVTAALVVYEVSSGDHDDDPDGEGDGVTSTVGCRVTGDRNVVALGLVERARQALLA